MKKTTYSGKSRQDLIKALMEKREDFRKLRFGSAGSKNRNVKVTASARKDVARIMTELNKK
ncbi:MAG: 50S ribosomal protein L29 [Candidatus Zambryskibacteria bacterium RIFCSPHIGHO2_02_FULL_43_14]|uniref:Large ribosomal subunit protein uL29 n=1 Tax=Candidatus Zambryskibacteria bacterium RIFCSPHIGHO2_02_FULL_43_14 TaxID=1802748 RepID=A0A1G2TFI5_9BACT|nr:MAG: 50S ribosomal protein L29 [Candidatus Zambryskibacteria bacterium RIFCSPHIGHO2_01_FULL_43_60]OHA96003.1 MAG: 50S ribosomal protein L29 [Candidatus Zambryskibacteria bacterium RIFCSPHIGHO2_02_FULL_43_14]OHB03111.1 MAG: 50S ribosomal protein L29 [Candidatus Zambryskibacteria bacterium RIFCSPLOWO2_01_FULL_42_41]